MAIIETARLLLRELSLDDAEFILRLLNEPSFVQNIGDKGVRTLEDARTYIMNGPMASYQRFGFGPWLVETKQSQAVGICGLLKREVLEDADIGYALVPEFWSRGFAAEAALGVLSYARNQLGLKRLLAAANADNLNSIRLLEKIGFRFERMTRLTEGEPEVKLFAFAVDD